MLPKQHSFTWTLKENQASEISSRKSKMQGDTAHVLKFGEHNEVIVDSDVLDQMFSHPDVKDRKVVVFSIIGAFRNGKSFFLDYCLRYLYANYKSIKNPTKDGAEKNWMGLSTEALTGFSWRAGVKRDTTGIIIWNDVFLHTMEKTGENLAIVVMDTQGLFDTETSSVENSKIFAISTLISSIQIFNLSRRIQEDQLQYLQFATEFAKFTARDSQGDGMAPFQNLTFLIRDWENQEEFELGFEGGSKYLKEVLQVKNGQKPELKSVRETISSSFEWLECCLMSYPGKNVAGSKNYNGQWSLMDEEFKDVLMITIEKLLDPKSLVLKKINGDGLKASELKEYIKSVASLFQSDTLPLAKSVYELVIDRQMTSLTEKCVDFYKETLAKILEKLTHNDLSVFRDLSASKALIMFKDKKKMGNAEHEKKHQARLEAVIEKLYTEWHSNTIKSLNQAKEEKAKLEKAIEEKHVMQRKALVIQKIATEAQNIATAKQEELKRAITEKQAMEQKFIEAQKLASARQVELEREKQLRKVDEEKFESQKKSLELRSTALSRFNASSKSGFELDDMYRELQIPSFRGYSKTSHYAGTQDRMRCQGTTQKGLQCKLNALPGSSRCRFNH